MRTELWIISKIFVNDVIYVTIFSAHGLARTHGKNGIWSWMNRDYLKVLRKWAHEHTCLSNERLSVEFLIMEHVVHVKKVWQVSFCPHWCHGVGLSSLYHQLSWTAIIFYEPLVSTRFWSFLWEEIYLFINLLFIYLLIIYLNIYVIYLLLLFKHPQDLAHSRFLIIVWWANECHRYLNSYS